MVNAITAIKFNMFSPEQVKQLATVRVVTSDLYDADGYPVEGGCMDPRMGVVDPGMKCRTCSSDIGECPGHFGYLELARPIIHVLYTKQIHSLLKIACRKCGRIMMKDNVSPKMLMKNPPNKCPFCGGKQKKITFVKPYAYYEGGEGKKDEINPMQIREMLEKITDEDMKKIGFNGGRPEWLIVTLLPIPPVTMRPSITMESGERSEDDLTHKLVDTIRINHSLKENIDIGAPEFILNDLWELLQYHVSTYFDNELTGIPKARHRSGRPLRGMMQRLKAKEGRIRGNLLGKRVNYSARTVISPDPRLSISELGVPNAIAADLTVPVFVNALNMKMVKDMIKDGKINYVTRPDGRKIKITADNKEDVVTNVTTGWNVDRQLRNGDVVLFNRQPSLHRVSIMAHKVVVMPYKTFRMNPSVCPPYNADFDGDEMNMHVPQTEEARTEAAMLMSVHNNIISPKFGGPLIGLDLDQISGSFLLTHKNVVLTREEASFLLGHAGIELDLPAGATITGKELYSLLIPKGVNAEFKNNYCDKCETCKKDKCEKDAFVFIRNGKILAGRMDTRAVGAMKGELINRIRHIAGDDLMRDFIDQAGRLGASYLMERGFSIGISDLDLTKEVMSNIRTEINRAEEDSQKLIAEYSSGNITMLPGMTATESMETQILNALSNGLNRVSEIVVDNVKYSDIRVMAESGAKGSMVNTTQMAACVGQENILGQRIKRGYAGRTLPHFKRNDLSPKCHGFVSRGFKQALTPYEIFWNIMNGREGLMDKSLRTRKSGYMQRRLVNALQDLKVSDDMTVRDAIGNIVQFVAGEDGINPTKSDWGAMKWNQVIQ